MQPKAQLIACIRWRSHTTGQYYCEYHDKRTGSFLSIGIALNQHDADMRAASRLAPHVIKAFPQLSRSG